VNNKFIFFIFLFCFFLLGFVSSLSITGQQFGELQRQEVSASQVSQSGVVVNVGNPFSGSEFSGGVNPIVVASGQSIISYFEIINLRVINQSKVNDAVERYRNLPPAQARQEQDRYAQSTPPVTDNLVNQKALS
jgi:hypothetical protein